MVFYQFFPGFQNMKFRKCLNLHLLLWYIWVFTSSNYSLIFKNYLYFENQEILAKNYFSPISTNFQLMKVHINNFFSTLHKAVIMEVIQMSVGLWRPVMERTVKYRSEYKSVISLKYQIRPLLPAIYIILIYKPGIVLYIEKLQTSMVYIDV